MPLKKAPKTLHYPLLMKLSWLVSLFRASVKTIRGNFNPKLFSKFRMAPYLLSIIASESSFLWKNHLSEMCLCYIEDYKLSFYSEKIRTHWLWSSIPPRWIETDTKDEQCHHWRAAVNAWSFPDGKKWWRYLSFLQSDRSGGSIESKGLDFFRLQCRMLTL